MERRAEQLIQQKGLVVVIMGADRRISQLSQQAL